MGGVVKWIWCNSAMRVSLGDFKSLVVSVESGGNESIDSYSRQGLIE